MNKILEAKILAPDIKLFRIEAPKIAAKRKPGQFIILRVHQDGERIPLTIADSNTQEGTINYYRSRYRQHHQTTQHIRSRRFYT
jgi:ferredoxin--NADP+ reductase